MSKLFWKPATLLYPVPPVLVSCGDFEGVKNIITIAWAGTVASDPVMVSISVRPERYSYRIIKETGEFVMNLPTRRLARAVDFCGVKSGKDVDKFVAMGLTPERARMVRAPLIAEAPLSLECKIDSIIPLGSHDLILAKVLGVHVAENLIEETGRLNLAKADLLTFVHGHYWTLNQSIGSFGFSVKKHPSKKVTIHAKST